MNAKIDSAQKNFENLIKDKSTTDNVKNNVMIRNLEYDARKENDSQITTNKVQSLLKWTKSPRQLRSNLSREREEMKIQVAS